MLNYQIAYLSKELSQITHQEIQKLKAISIDQHNWGIGSKLPAVSLRAAWNEKGLFLFFSVNEKESLRRFTTTNEAVWRDSCVEFFIQPNPSEPTYHNFEFNSLGTLLSQSGTNRDNRLFISPEEAKEIQTIQNFKIESESPYSATWSLHLFIPSSILDRREIKLDEGREYRANFYKCGDDLQDFHYLSWNPINCENPDFHRTDYFGIIKLIK